MEDCFWWFKTRRLDALCEIFENNGDLQTFIELLSTFDKPIPPIILYEAIRAATMPFVLAILYQDTVAWNRTIAVRALPFHTIYCRDPETRWLLLKINAARQCCVRFFHQHCSSSAFHEDVARGRERYKYQHPARLENDEKCRKA